MQRLILFRHGKAERRAPGGGDLERALAPRGRTDALAVAQALASAGFAPDLALVSAATRTRQTWEEARAAFPKAKAEITPKLYQADAKTLFEAARGERADTVMLVAHNPGLHELALELAEDGADRQLKAELELGFPTAAAAVFGFGEEGGVADGRLFIPSKVA